MPTAIKFAIQQVHDYVDRRRVERRSRELTSKYSRALRRQTSERVDLEIAAELTALVELGRDRVGASSESGDPAALKRLEAFASQAVAKLGLPEDFNEAA
jgi:hypothetical protein